MFLLLRVCSASNTCCRGRHVPDWPNLSKIEQCAHDQCEILRALTGPSRDIGPENVGSGSENTKSSHGRLNALINPHTLIFTIILQSIVIFVHFVCIFMNTSIFYLKMTKFKNSMCFYEGFQAWLRPTKKKWTSLLENAPMGQKKKKILAWIAASLEKECKKGIWNKTVSATLLNSLWSIECPQHCAFAQYLLIHIIVKIRMCAQIDRIAQTMCRCLVRCIGNEGLRYFWIGMVLPDDTSFNKGEDKLSFGAILTNLPTTATVNQILRFVKDKTRESDDQSLRLLKELQEGQRWFIELEPLKTMFQGI
uniref:Uncharacterized protein n=1 Tax=Romanomermis culicivorax TaxID=13658 RepID=A0A915HV44_ROMCU